MRRGCAKLLVDGLGTPLGDGDRVGISVPLLYEEDGRTLVHSLRRESSVTRALGEAVIGNRRAGRFPHLSELVTDSAAYERPTYADWATGALMALSADCLAACGPWDESFFLYSEETEYCLRARDRGFATRLEAGGLGHPSRRGLAGLAAPVDPADAEPRTALRAPATARWRRRPSGPPSCSGRPRGARSAARPAVRPRPHSPGRAPCAARRGPDR